jgi:type I restriction enzyme R subunit
MNATIDPAVERFKAMQQVDEAAADVWRKQLTAFRNLYAFLSQVIPYQDSDLERLYTFLRHLAKKLPRRTNAAQYDFEDDVYLEYYRLQKISEGSIDLSNGYAAPLDGPKEVGTSILRDSPVTLSRVIDIVNDRFGTDFNQADQLFFDQVIEVAARAEELRQAAQVNTEDKFSLLFNRLLESLFIERIDQNEEIFARFMNDPAFQQVISNILGAEVYRRLTDKEQPPQRYQRN